MKEADLEWVEDAIYHLVYWIQREDSMKHFENCYFCALIAKANGERDQHVSATRTRLRIRVLKT